MSGLIDLSLSNGNAYVWRAEDWYKLRSEYRIIGELIGCLSKLPRQEVFMGLPMLLMSEEVTLLIEKNLVRLVDYVSMYKAPSEELKKIFHEYRNNLYVEQEVCLRDERKNQVLLMMDKIVEGKKRKILGIDTGKKKIKNKKLDAETEQLMEGINIDRNVLLEEELAKLPKLAQSDAFVQTHTAYPWSANVEIKTESWKYPSTSQEVIRYKVYKDLWEKGFYVTNGEKFGGDFLVYPGDPIMFHSQFIVLCKERNEEMPINELITQCRVGCNVRKTQVFATIDENNQDVKYQSFQWADSSQL